MNWKGGRGVFHDHYGMYPYTCYAGVRVIYPRVLVQTGNFVCLTEVASFCRISQQFSCTPFCVVFLSSFWSHTPKSKLKISGLSSSQNARRSRKYLNFRSRCSCLVKPLEDFSNFQLQSLKGLHSLRYAPKKTLIIHPKRKLFSLAPRRANSCKREAGNSSLNN